MAGCLEFVHFPNPYSIQARSGHRFPISFLPHFYVCPCTRMCVWCGVVCVCVCVQCPSAPVCVQRTLGVLSCHCPRYSFGNLEITILPRWLARCPSVFRSSDPWLWLQVHTCLAFTCMPWDSGSRVFTPWALTHREISPSHFHVVFFFPDRGYGVHRNWTIYQRLFGSVQVVLASEPRFTSLCTAVQGNRESRSFPAVRCLPRILP